MFLGEFILIYHCLEIKNNMQNFLEKLLNYNNKYFGLRHAQSVANLTRKTVGDPGIGLSNFGVTELGRQQAVLVAENNREIFKQGEWEIYCSDFLRTKETAEIVCDQLGWDFAQVIFDLRLRERFFGDYEGQNNFKYEEFALPDLDSPDWRDKNVESAGAVLERTSELIAEIEQKFSGKNVLLVSHGDVLQILECGFKRVSPGRHFLMEPMLNAMLRTYN
jgi:probable phosphoglycerate mutase